MCVCSADDMAQVAASNTATDDVTN